MTEFVERPQAACGPNFVQPWVHNIIRNFGTSPLPQLLRSEHCYCLAAILELGMQSKLSGRNSWGLVFSRVAQNAV